jgi:hypothetical protein
MRFFADGQTQSRRTANGCAEWYGQTDIQDATLGLFAVGLSPSILTLRILLKLNASRF